MASLLPFRALRYARQPDFTFIPGEDPTPCIAPGMLVEDASPSLFIYEQKFGDESRTGVAGLLNRAEAIVLPHEEILPTGVAGCRNEGLQSSSIFLWCRDEDALLAPLLQGQGTPVIHTADRFGCTHTVWRAHNPSALQSAMDGQQLFIADGHHRYAAGWNLAAIQVRTPSLRTRAAHRLVFEDIELPGTRPVENLDAFWADTPRGHVRFGVLMPDGALRGLELPHDKSERNVTVLRRWVLHDRPFQTARSVESARAAVAAGAARMAFLLNPLSVDKIETDARAGKLLPPKSTDFYPKLAGGLLMAPHQNEKVSPAVPQRPGVRNPSS